MDKQRIKLTQEKETLLVPLYSKAMESARTQPILIDTKANEILAGIDYEFKDLQIPRQTLITLAMRAKKMDSVVNEFSAHVENPIILHLGCGLDSRVNRVNRAKGDWYDLDFPEVIEIRKHFYQESEHYHMISSSVTDLTWLSQVKENGPACIIAEGLLMYLTEDAVKQLFISLQTRWPSSEICFDAYSRLTAKSVNNHPSIKKTGARIYWGIDNFAEIQGWGKGVQLIEEWYFTDSEDIASLDFLDRLLFRTMGSFHAAKKAHRVLHVQL